MRSMTVSRESYGGHTWNPVLLQNFHTYSSSSFPMKHLDLDTGPSQYTALLLEIGAHLRAKCVDFPQEVFHFDRLPARSISTPLEKIAMDNGVPAEPAPGDFPESLVVVVSRWSLDDGATRPKRR